MLSFFNTLASFAVATALTVTSLFGYAPSVKVGGTTPKVVALFETSLASKITKTDTSMTLVSGTDKAGNLLSGYIAFIIDEGTASEEFVAGTASGTSVTGLIRGVDVVTGNTTSSLLAFEHRRGASVKITTFPALGVISRQLRGEDTIAQPIKYDSSVSTSTIGADASNLATVGYVASVAYGSLPISVSVGGTGTSTIPKGFVWASGTDALTSVAPPLGPTYIASSSNYTWAGSHDFQSTTKLSSLSYGLVVASGTTALSTIAPSTTGNLLTSSGTTWVSKPFTVSGIIGNATTSAGCSSTAATDGFLIAKATAQNNSGVYGISCTSGGTVTYGWLYPNSTGVYDVTCQIPVKKGNSYVGATSTASFAANPNLTCTFIPLGN